MSRFSVLRPVADLRRTPDGARDRQVLLGETGTVTDAHGPWSQVQMDKDGYVGFVQNVMLGPVVTPTYKVASRATHCYEAADFKSPDVMSLSHGSRVVVKGTYGKFAQTEVGFIPLQHLCALDECAQDTIGTARLFLGTPYLWGGNSAWGIDCSGLVQAAMTAAGHPCAGDSGDQAKTLGGDVMGDEFTKGDILFWKGHVGLVSGPDRLIHANAHHMMVVEEPLQAAIKRIEENGDGPVTGHRRI